MIALLRQPANARYAGVCALMILLSTLAGCASTPSLAPELRRQLPPRVQLDDVPFHGQRDYQCGPASLAMVFQAAGRGATVDALIPQVFLPGREGSVQPEMLATVRRHGLIPFRLPGRYGALLAELAAGHPAVVMQNLALPAWPVWHYAVAIGYDRAAETLTLHTGMTPRREVDAGRFDATWARSGRWAFVALPPGRLPASAGAETMLQAIADFESARGPRAALPAWQALVARHPEHAMARFALGNARHALGDRAGARAAFRAATEADAELAPAWLNLGLLARQAGDRAAARHALERAAALPGPWQPRARRALDEETDA